MNPSRPPSSNLGNAVKGSLHSDGGYPPSDETFFTYLSMMKRLKKHPYTGLTVAGCLALLNGCSSPAQPTAEKPNLVFIFADDMGYGDVSALNPAAKLTTPHIDRMAREGVTFTDAHSCSSVSTPSRYGLLTGRYNWRSELKESVLFGYDKALISASRRTIAQVLSEQGYHTAAIGKWHLGWDWPFVGNPDERQVDFSQPIQNGPTTRGFDYFYGIAGSLDMPPYVYVENDRVTALPDRETSRKGPYEWWRKGPTGADFRHEETLPHLVDQAVTYIQKQSKQQQPFFLYLPLPAPHTPILPSAEYQGKSGLNPYGDFVLMVDDMVGKVMQALEKAGVADHTLVVFSADNGCSPEANYPVLAEKGHHPSYIYRGHKADLYEGGHRVPCVVRWPKGITRPHSIQQTVCLTDFYATFAHLAGYTLKDSEGEDSYDLVPLLTAEKEDRVIREATVHHSIEGNFTLRKGKWKLLLAPHSGGWSYPRPGADDSIISTLPPVQLYDMEKDPSEQHNVCAEHPEVVRELTALMTKYVQTGRSTPGTPQKNDGSARWKQLDWMQE